MVELRSSTRLRLKREAEQEAESASKDDAKESKTETSKKDKRVPLSTPKKSQLNKKQKLPVEADKKSSNAVSASSINNETLEIGGSLPDLTLLNQSNKKISLQKLIKRKKILVIFAYPKASTPGCTRQVCAFRDSYDDLKSKATVIGVSSDTVNAQDKFHTKFELPYDLLSDPKRELIGLLGAKKTPSSGTIRSYWIFVEGKLKYKKIKVSPEDSLLETKEHILEIVKTLSK